MSAQHTPGPWAATADGRIPVLVVSPASQIGIAIIGNGLNGGPLDFKEVAANARLIAAAPELLEALKALLDCGPDHCDYPSRCGLSGNDERVIRARALIAKAEGRT